MGRGGSRGRQGEGVGPGVGEWGQGWDGARGGCGQGCLSKVGWLESRVSKMEGWASTWGSVLRFYRGVGGSAGCVEG